MTSAAWASFLHGAHPVSMSYEDIITKLQEHFDPRLLSSSKRDQTTTETLAEYVAEFRRHAVKCDFGGHFNEALDRFVRSEAILRKLFTGAGLAELYMQVATPQNQPMQMQSLKAKMPVVA